MEPAKQRKISEEGRARISASRVGKKWSQEVKDKISASKKGTICSAEHRSKLSAAGKGRTPWNKGIRGVFKHSDEAKAKISACKKGKKIPPEIVEKTAAKLRGRKLSDEHRAKLCEKRKGRRPGLGRKQSEEERQKHREASLRLGLKPPNCKGVTRSLETRKRMSEAQRREGYMQTARGERAPNWRGGITPQNRKLRGSPEFKVWRDAVFTRDDWTCQKCWARGVHLHSHHIKEFAKYPGLRFELSNGITLCAPCHRKLHGIEKKDLVTICTKKGKIVQIPSWRLKERIKQGCTLLTAFTPAT